MDKQKPLRRQLDLFSLDGADWSSEDNLTPERARMASQARARVSESFQEPWRKLIEGQPPIGKGIHYGTGIGKTYQASKLAVLAVDQNVQLVYTSSTRALIAQAKAAFERALEGTGIPVYVAYGVEDHWTDEIINSVAPKAVDEVFALKRHHPEFWRGLEKKFLGMTREDRRSGPPSFDAFMDKARESLKSLQALVTQTASAGQGIFDTLDEIETLYLKRKNALTDTLKKLCQLAVRLDVETPFTETYARNLGKQCRRLFPLDYARMIPGPLLMTHAKFMVGPELAVRPLNMNKRYRPRPSEAPSPDSHVLWMHFLNAELRRGSLLILDEEEDAYGTLFEALSGFIDSPQAWLPSITSLELSFNWRMFEYSVIDRGERQLIFDNLSTLISKSGTVEEILQRYRNQEIDELEAREYILEMLDIPLRTPEEAKVGLFDWLKKACRDTLRKDVPKGASIRDCYYGMEYTVACWRSIQHILWFIEKHTLYEDEKSMRDRLLRLIQDVCSKQQLLIRRESLAEVGDHLRYLFFDDRLRLVDQNMLNNIYVSRSSDNSSLELVYRPEGSVSGDLFSLAVLLKLLLWSAVIITDSKLKIPAANAPERVDPELAPFLEPLRELKRLFSKKSLGLRLHEVLEDQLESAQDRVIDDSVIFEEAKGFFTLWVEEQTTRNEQYLSARFSAYALTRSPESVVLAAARGPVQDDLLLGPVRNIVYFMSATSGIGAAFEFDRTYVPQLLRRAGGDFFGFNSLEADITALLKEFTPRKYEVGFFSTESAHSGAGELMGIAPENVRILRSVLPPPEYDQYKHNRHKKAELAVFYDTLSYLVEQSGPQAGMVFTQTTQHILHAVETALAIGSVGVRQPDEKYDRIYEIDPVALGMNPRDSRPVVLVLFEAGFLKKLRSSRFAGLYGQLGLEGFSQQPGEDEGVEVNADELDALQKALQPYRNLEKNKILFVSRYISASRGLSLSAYCGQPENERDYDFIVLANHRFYDTFLVRREKRPASPQMMMAAMKYLRDAGELGLMPLSEFAKRLCQYPRDLLSHARLLEHFASILQAAGRVDRGHELPSIQRIFITADYVPELVEGNEVASFLLRATKLPQSIILAAQDYYWRISPHINNFDAYFAEEVELAQAFLNLVERFKYDIFSNSDIEQRRRASLTWAGLRHPNALRDPTAYKGHITAMDWPYEESSRQAFLAYLYLDATPFGGDQGLMKELPLFDLKVSNESIRILSDPPHAPDPNGRRYRPTEHLFNLHRLTDNSKNDYAKLCAALGFNPEKLFGNLLPRPHFLTNFIKGFVGECLVGQALKDAGIEVFPETWAIERNVFERFDLYGRLPSGRLFAIDCKHWARATARSRSDKLQEDARRKATYVVNQLGESPIFLYINVLGGSSSPPQRENGLDIEFFSLCNDQYREGQLSTRFMNLFYAR